MQGNDLVGIYKRLVSSEIYKSDLQSADAELTSEKPQLDARTMPMRRAKA